MAATLNELAKVATNPLNKAILLNLLRQSKILQLAPITNVNGLKITATRWQTLPSVGTRKIGGTYTEATGQLEQVQETLAIYGGDLKVDRVLTLDRTVIEDPLITQVKMKSQSIASKFNEDFILGDNAVNPDGFEGLTKRVSNFPARMTINLATNDSLKVFASEANEQTFLDGIHEAMHKVGGADCLIMNENTYLKFAGVLRRLKLLDTTKDQYDRVWNMFGNAKLIDVGLKSDQATEIITDTEDPGDAGNDSTSIYAARFGSDDGLHIIQLAGTSPEPYDPLGGKETDAGPQFLRRIDWVIGLQTLGRFAVARVKNFKMAAA